MLENTTSTNYILPVEIGDSYQFQVRGFDIAGNVSAWSSRGEISVDWSKEVVLNEIAYAPTAQENCGGEWLELYNPQALDLSGWSIEILSDTSSSTVFITSSSTEKYFVVSNLDIPDSGAQIILKDSTGKIIDESNQVAGWFATNNFWHARSLERINSNLSGNLVNNWRVNNSLRFSLYDNSCGQNYSSRGMSNSGYYFLSKKLSQDYFFATSSTENFVLHLTKENNPYIFDEKVILPANYTLVVDPGVVVVSKLVDASLEVSGKLQINGTADDPVYFTSPRDKTVADWYLSGYPSTLPAGDPAPGDWSVIVVKGGGELSANYANFWYGGDTYRNGDCFVCYAQQVIRNEGGIVIVNNSSFDNMEFTDDYADNDDAYIWNAGYVELNNSVFNSGYRALKSLENTHVSLSGNTFSNFTITEAQPLDVREAVLNKWENNVFENNAFNSVVLPVLNISEDYTLSADYNNVIFDGINVSSTATLTILPGVDVNLNANTWLKVEGNLQALGEEGSHIRFCPSSACAGFLFQNSSDNVLSYVDIKNAGYHSTYPFRENKNYTAPIWTINSSLSIDNSSIMDNRSPTGFGICSAGSNLDVRDSEFGWSYDWRQTHYSWETGGIKLNGGNLHIENTDFHFMNYAIEARQGGAVVTYDNMSPANFFNMYSIPQHNQNWLPFDIFPFASR